MGVCRLRNGNNKKDMTDITLWSVNWNQRNCTELLLKSYVRHHYVGEPLKLMLIDNGSTDDSKQWLCDNDIPFVSLTQNIWHEPALNLSYNSINTKYCLLCDTDVEILENIYSYIDQFDENCISAGEYISWDCFHDQKIMPRISPWFMLWDIKKAKETGIDKWREGGNWIYDVGSWYTEQLQQRGFVNLDIERNPGDQDKDLVSMVYKTHVHFGKTSWDIGQHQDRKDEVQKRRDYIKERLVLYEDIDLKGKFVL